MSEESTPASIRRSELDIRARELELEREALELRKAETAIEFAKFGFRGTLFGAFAGMALVLGLGVINAISDFGFGGWHIFGILFLVLLGVIVFGYLSLRQPIKMAAKFWDKMSLEIDQTAGKG